MDRASSPFTAKRVLLVGGGRWGRVHADILRRVLPANGEVTWVSTHNRLALAQLASAWADTGPRFRMLNELDEALAVGQDAAIIVSAPHMHAADARTVLQAKMPVLVEKPFVTRSFDAAELVRIAEQRGLLLGVGLHLLFTSYLHQFQQILSDREVRTVAVEWYDPESEIRYGELKRLNVSVQKIHDAFSHIWSIIHVLFRNRPMVVSGASVGGGASTEIRLDVAGIEIVTRIDRRAQYRRRRVAVVFAGGGSAELDFTTEPGVVAVDGTEFPAASDWSSQPSPLTLETVSFLSALDSPADAANWPGRAQFVVSGVSVAEDIAERVSEIEAAILAEAFLRDNLVEADARAIISDNIGPELMEQGVRGPEAESELETIFSAFVKRETNEIFGYERSLRRQSRFLQRVKARIA
ncbi:Gfo/Idh/MocA family oxidoreductase [Bradyrhizobium sp. Ash2021]|nr:Gfo/Idh/MocA family oxidoreductase [Bradyrhizobium sp. Ash2021]